MRIMKIKWYVLPFANGPYLTSFLNGVKNPLSARTRYRILRTARMTSSAVRSPKRRGLFNTFTAFLSILKILMIPSKRVFVLSWRCWRLCGEIAFLAVTCSSALAQAPKLLDVIECRRAAHPIRIDGKLDAEEWKDAFIVCEFAVPNQNRAPKTTTTFRLLWDDKYLYFAAEMEDADVYADVRKPNGITWENDVIELFLKPSEKKLPYYEFQVNAANTPLELYFPSRGAGGFRRFAPITHIGLQSAVVVKGTLNNWHDKDEGWVVEGRIPWTDFSETGGAPKPGDVWRGAICRYDYSVAFEQPELSSSAPVPGSFHAYENYNKVRFK